MTYSFFAGLFKTTLHFLNHEHLSVIPTNLLTSIVSNRSEQTIDIDLVSFDYHARILDNAFYSNVSKIDRCKLITTNLMSSFKMIWLVMTFGEECLWLVLGPCIIEQN